MYAGFYVSQDKLDSTMPFLSPPKDNYSVPYLKTDCPGQGISLIMVLSLSPFRPQLKGLSKVLRGRCKVKLAQRILICNPHSDSHFVDLFSSIRLCWWPCGVPQQFLQNCDSLHV